MNNVSVIIIDPQKGFCSSSGSLALEYGSDELERIDKAISNILVSVSGFIRCHLVTSEYAPAQFTHGNLDHKLANLCVPNTSEDCEIIDGLRDKDFYSISIKNQQSALSSESFKIAIDKDIKEGIKRFIICGFLLEHCVKRTAEDLKEYVARQNAEVIVCSDLSATRVENYENGIVDSVY